MIKLRAKRLFRSNSKPNSKSNGRGCGVGGGRVIEWEVRPGGMLVQKREGGGDGRKEVIQVRVWTGSKWHEIHIGATSTFGELKVLITLVTGLEPREQRLLFRGKEREDGDHLHMVGVKDADKVLMLEDPAIKERKLRALGNQVFGTPCSSIKVRRQQSSAESGSVEAMTTKLNVASKVGIVVHNQSIVGKHEHVYLARALRRKISQLMSSLYRHTGVSINRSKPE